MLPAGYFAPTLLSEQSPKSTSLSRCVADSVQSTRAHVREQATAIYSASCRRPCAQGIFPRTADGLRGRPQTVVAKAGKRPLAFRPSTSGASLYDARKEVHTHGRGTAHREGHPKTTQIAPGTRRGSYGFIVRASRPGAAPPARERAAVAAPWPRSAGSVRA
jgi:hypothetical protein